MPKRIRCDLCHRLIPPHAHYIVNIEVFADPSMPPTTGDELAELDFDDELQKLIDQMKDLSADDLQDQVHRKFHFRICRPCQIRFLANPLGKPRQTRTGKN